MDELKKRILVESSRLFITKGCKSITMDYVANHLGVSKRTLYEIFKDKEELLEQSLIYKSSQIESFYNEIISDDSDNVLEKILYLSFSNKEVYIKMQIDLINDIRKFYPKVYVNTFLKFNKLKIELIDKMFQKGKKDGYVKENIDTTLISYLIDDLSQLIMNEDTYPYNLHGKKELSDVVVISFLRGISTKHGIEIIDKFLENPTINDFNCFFSTQHQV